MFFSFIFDKMNKKYWGVIISILQDIWNGFDLSPLFDFLLALVPAALCVSVHELSHGIAAYLLGDDTAKKAGRLSLNPLKHIDLMGLIMLAVFRVGWAKPVPVNMYNFRKPRRDMAITSLAGPLSNFILAIIFLFFYGLLFHTLYLSVIGSYLLDMLIIGTYTTIGLGMFNLLPIPPLDGAKILFSLFGDRVYYRVLKYERYGSIILIALAATGAISGFLAILINKVFSVFVPVATFAANIF